jgi:hypothetical protein
MSLCWTGLQHANDEYCFVPTEDYGWPTESSFREPQKQKIKRDPPQVTTLKISWNKALFDCCIQDSRFKDFVG